VAELAYQVTGFAYQGAGEFAYQGREDGVVVGGGLPQFAYTGRVRIPALLKVELDDEKLARRIREGTLKAPVLPADTKADFSAYYQKSEKLAAAIAKRRAEAAKLRARIARLEADALAVKAQARAALEHRLLIAQQQLALLAVQEAMLLEEIEAIDVAFFACVALVVVIQ